MTEIEHYLILIEGEPPSNYSAWSPAPEPSGPGVYIERAIAT
jgi:hypothetical protein